MKIKGKGFRMTIGSCSASAASLSLPGPNSPTGETSADKGNARGTGRCDEARVSARRAAPERAHHAVHHPEARQDAEGVHQPVDADRQAPSKPTTSLTHATAAAPNAAARSSSETTRFGEGHAGHSPLETKRTAPRR